MSDLDLAPVETSCTAGPDAGPVHEVLTGREVVLAKTTLVNRILPHRQRRMVGAWCFLDHFGPDAVISMPGMRVPPHPHIGLQTVTWLVEGAVEHRDSLGSVQLIAPGELNLMTAGRGISHSEESPADRPPTLHGLQMWVALPAAVRGIEPRFEHLAALPRFTNGGLTGTVLVGELAGQRSPARVHTPLLGAELALAPGTDATLPLDPAYEHGVLLIEGAATVDDVPVEVGTMLYLGRDRSDLSLRSGGGGRLLLLGGEPFEEEIVMWWNFVGGSHDEVVTAREDWMRAERFGADGPVEPTESVDLPLGPDRFGTVEGFDGRPLPAPELPNATLRARGRYQPPGAGPRQA